MNVESLDLPALHTGTTFLKCGKRGYPHERYVRLSQDNKYLLWEARFDFRRDKIRKIPLHEVSQIIKGQKTDNFLRFKTLISSCEKVSFSLVYGNRSFDVVAPSRDTFRTFYFGLKAVLKTIEEERENQDIDRRFLKSKWDVADSDNFGKLTKLEIANLVASLNISLPSKTIYKFFDEIDLARTGTIGFDDFYRLMDILRRR
eukprot:gene3750-7444_t